MPPAQSYPLAALSRYVSLAVSVTLVESNPARTSDPVHGACAERDLRVSSPVDHATTFVKGEEEEKVLIANS